MPGPTLSPGGHAAPLDYHRTLLDDPHRLDAYDRAIRHLVRPGDVVLDVGTGTGLLALLAARRGARVHAVESMPVAHVARALAAQNGLADRITVHEADLRTLTPVEPVDLIVGEFMGRFGAEDAMLEAVAAAGRWLRPGGRFCPRRIQLHLAAAGDFSFYAVDLFSAPLLGLDLRPALAAAQASSYGGRLTPDRMLGPSQSVATLAPPAVSAALTVHADLPIARAGLVQAVCGWFEAELCDGVTLSTAPGIHTHWGQALFPVPATPVGPGDVLSVTLRWLPSELGWAWSGEIAGQPFELATQDLPGPVPDVAPGAAWSPADDATLHRLNAEGVAAYEASRFADAAAAWESAAAQLGPAHDPLAPALFENVGLARASMGQFRPAIRAFLRALDGRPTSREQSLRLLVACLRYDGRHQDAATRQAEYEAAFGPYHPEPR